MHREREYRGSRWEFNWVRHHSGGQADQSEVLDDCYYVTSTLGLPLRGSHYYILQIILLYSLCKIFEFVPLIIISTLL